MTNTILLTIDSLRFDHFNEKHFPRCWELFTDSCTRFSNARSSGVGTPFGVAPVLTGQMAKSDGAIASEASIAHEFAFASALTNNPHLGRHRGYGAGFDRFDTGPRSTKRTVAGTVDTAISDIGRDGLYWIHIMEPHYPFDVPASVNDRFVDGEATPADIEQLRRAYGRAVRETDRELHRLFEYLRETGRWGESIVIVVADHGEAFGERGIFNHAWDAQPIDELVHVPLVAKFPGESPACVDRLTWTGRIAEAIRSRSLDPLRGGEQRIRSYSNEWARVDTPEGTEYIRESPYQIDELGQSSGLVDRLKALGYR